MGCVTRTYLPCVVLLLCALSLLSYMREKKHIHLAQVEADSQPAGLAQADQHTLLNVSTLRSSFPLVGWRSSSAVRTVHWPPPPERSNGYLVVRCNGGLNQQRSAICNAVLAARIMNATLVVPELDTNSFWHDRSGFSGIYDVDHFISSLANDVKIVKRLPYFLVNRRRKRRLKPIQMIPPRNALPDWYISVALKKMREHRAVYLSPFAHRLAEDLDNPEYQRLRCRVNFHALRFREDVMNLSSSIVSRLRSGGHFLSIHLRFEMDMLAFAGCVDIFTPEEQEILLKYRKENFAEKTLISSERRMIGKCPLTPEEVGLILRSLGFDKSTRLYLAAGEIFGGERVLQPLRSLFPRLENHTSMATSRELQKFSSEGRGLIGPAVDYMVCLLSDVFIPTYDGPSNFANNLMGHRLYYGFRKTIRPDRKALAPLFLAREAGVIEKEAFEMKVREVMGRSWLSGLQRRVPPESFYTNPWPECFCKPHARMQAHRCPNPEHMLAQDDGDDNSSDIAA
ncbi:hypothetical protein CY35_01G176600 [Sphagnum magellanicum]|nr:hypothetical protein CY35_01G176600 [Sphagnum magellanicum]